MLQFLSIVKWDRKPLISPLIIIEIIDYLCCNLSFIFMRWWPSKFCSSFNFRGPILLNKEFISYITRLKTFQSMSTPRTDWISTAFWLHFDFILAAFWLYFHCILTEFGYIFTQFWLQFNWILAAFWLNFGCILIEFWLHFGCIWTQNELKLTSSKNVTMNEKKDRLERKIDSN